MKTVAKDFVSKRDISKKDVLLLRRIRRHIRSAIAWYDVDHGIPSFYNSKSYMHAKKCDPFDSKIYESTPYYVRSSKAIEDIAFKILKLIKKQYGVDK